MSKEAIKSLSLKVQLFGEFRVWRGKGRVKTLIKLKEWKTAKNKALLQILLSERGRSFTNDELIESLWPDTDPLKAATTLRKRVSELRRILEPNLERGSQSNYVLTCYQGYRFNPQADCFTDLDAFVTHYESGNRRRNKNQFGKAIWEYEKAAKLYQGGYTVEDPYEEWAIKQRERWQNIYLDLLSCLAECHAHLGRYRRAIAYCHQALGIQEYQESIYRQLMLYCYLSGDQGEALRTWEQCRRVLQEQLGVEPASQTKKLYQQILRHDLPEADYKLLPTPLQRHPLPFVGREKEYAHLLHHLNEAQTGHGRMVLICGEAGVGKTRLVQEFIDYAQNKGALILYGRCQSQVSQPYQPLVDAIQGCLSYLNKEDLASIAPLWLAEVARLVPELCSVVAGLPTSPPLPPKQERERFFEGLTQFIIGLAKSVNFSRPLILFLDDLHRAASATVDFLCHLLPRLAEEPLLVLGAYRSEGIGKDHPLLDLEQSVGGKESIYSLTLSSLSYKAVDQLLEALSPSIGRDFRYLFYQKIQGNPLFIVAVLQNLFEGGAIRVAEDGSWIVNIGKAKKCIPPKIEEIVKRRLRRLGEEEQRLLQLAAVIGRSFTHEFLEQVWGGVRELEKLLKAQLLVIEHDGRYNFSHELIREIIYNSIGPERRILHRQVGESIERLYFERLEGYWETLAYHYHEGKEWGKALNYALLAIEKAMEGYQNQEALKLAELGLKAADKLERGGGSRTAKEKRSTILSKRAAIYDMLGKREDQSKDIESLFVIADQLGDDLKRAQAHEQKSRWYLALGKNQEAREEASKSLDLRQKAKEKDKSGEGHCLNDLGNVYQVLGNAKEALRCYKQAYKILKEARDRGGEAAALNNIGVICRFLGRHHEALEYFEGACAIRKERGERREEGQTLANIGNVYWALGKLEEVLKYYKQSLEIFKLIGDRRGERMILFNMGIAHSSRGDCRKALECYKKAYQIAKEVRDKGGEGATLSDLGTIYADLGDYKEALRYFEQAHKIFKETGGRPRIGMTLNNLGNLHLRLEKQQEALKYFQQAYQLRKELGDKRRQALDLSGIGAARLGLGECREALECFEQALKIIDELGVKGLLIELLSRKGLAYLGLGNCSWALRCSQEAVKLLEEGESTEYPHEIYFTHFKVLFACGLKEEALTYLKKAYDEVIRRADKIEDETLRKSFLNVRLNRKIVEEQGKCKAS